MLKFIMYIVVAGWMLFLSQNASASIAMGPITDPTNGHDYYLLSQDSWTNSEAEAVTLGGTLATINDATEQAWVFTTFGSDKNLWIGLYDPTLDAGGGHANNFVWADGETASYTDWSPGEPNNANAGEYWVIMWGNDSDVARDPSRRPYGTWNDLNDSGLLTVDHVSGAYGVVEVAPEPASLSILACASAILVLRRRSMAANSV